jgi:hypothetical protein
MTTLTLQSKQFTMADMRELERHGLVAGLTPPEDTVKAPEGQFKAKALYKTEPRYGGHMLLFVSLNLLEGKLNYHPGNEEVFLINPYERTKPLIWVFGLKKRAEIEAKIANNTLTAADFAAYEMPFNDWQLSCFTVLAGTLHYEITLPGPEPNPYFWVGESGELPRIDLDLHDYILKVESKGEG